MDPAIDRRNRKARRTLAGEATGGPSPDGMPFRALGTFFGLAFALTWGIAALLILFPDQVQAVFGPLGYTNPLFSASRGSILIAVLFHFQINNPIWPDALPWAALTFSLAAVAVVWWNRTAMLSRSGAATRILMEPASELPRSTGRKWRREPEMAAEDYRPAESELA